MDNKVVYKVGLSFSDVLQTIFIVLKLTGVIDWSWWWVVSPTLIPLGIAFFIFIVAIIISGIIWAAEKRHK